MRPRPQLTVPPPVDPARAEREVGACLAGRDQARHVLRVVREVAVDLEHELGAVREGAAEPGDVRRPEPLLLRRGGAPRPRASSAASRSAISPVPSGELSSITSTRSRAVSSCSPSARTIGSRLSRSLYVGRQTIARIGQSCRVRGRPMIGAWSRRFLATASWRTSSTCSPTCPRSSASSRSASVAYRRAAARIRDTASSVAELALEGKAKELPDIGKTIEEKIVEVVETGEMEALAKRRARGARRGRRRSCGCRGSARRRRRGSGASSASRRSRS